MLDLKRLGDSSSMGTPEDESPEAASAAEAGNAAPAEASAPAVPRKIPLGKLQRAATQESEVERPPVAVLEEPAGASDAPATGTEIGDIASLIQPRGLMTEAEVSPATSQGAGQAAPTPVDGPISVEGSETAAPAAPKADAAADVPDSKPDEVPDGEKRPDEEELEAQRRAALAPLASLVASLPDTPEALGISRALGAAVLAEKAKKEGASKDEAAALARAHSRGGGGGRSIFGGGNKQPSQGLSRIMDRFRVGQRASGIAQLQDRIYAIKVGQICEAKQGIERGAADLASKVTAFNAAFTGSSAFAKIRDIALGRGMSVDDYMADVNARPDLPANKEGRDAAKAALAEPAVTKAWAEVEASREGLAKAAERARQEYEITASNFPDKPEVHAMAEDVAETAKQAIDAVPAPAFEDPDKEGKLREKLEELKEQMEEMVKKFVQAIKAAFGRG